ncbi:Outer membrane protein assembly factor BamB precursor [Candidatus Arsenophonus lipoptenae]|uniref:Outer membrane protein assembly factor BamB n=1 Tax=Candidatus Arsenophonus lipoptenae TaxID=634113 RepID=A0A0X9VLY7_9GAMM|nr:outer membrane protein assembly factor BamB [Candidatus Arsenophonus lipoptenae]AMA64701.1 Outer membrane protein assembly factor BamB precursor [Candidatus Arsenophonus lipoptenae]
MQFNNQFLFSLLVMNLLIGCTMEKDSIMKSSLPKIKNQFNPSIVWSIPVGIGSGEYYSKLAPTYADYAVYAADRQGIVKAINFDSGKILWSIDLSKTVGLFTNHVSALISSGLTISGNNIYMGTETGKVIALNKNNGVVVWKTEVDGEVLSNPIISNTIVLIHTSNGVLYALDIQNGQIKWSINLETSIFSIRGKSSPSIVHGVAIIGSDNGRIVAIMLPQGEIIWQQYISEIHGVTEIDRLHDVNIMPLIDINRNNIFAIAYNGDLVAIDINSSKIIWKREIGSVNDIVGDKKNIYLVDQNDRVLSVRKNDGIILWIQNALLHRNLTDPVIYDDYLVIGDSEGYIHWLSIKDGHFVAQNKIDKSGLRSHPIIANNKLLIQSKNGTLYLIKR